MAWTAIENFNSYSDGDLAGESGGSGWSAAWSNGATAVWNVQGTTVYEGAKGISCNDGAANPFYSRTLTTAISDNGVVYFAMRKSSAAAGEIAFSLRSSAGSRVQVKMTAAGNITIQGTTTQTVLTGYSANTWYAFKLTFNVSGATAVVAYSTGTYQGGGSWSADSSSVTLQNSGNIDRVGVGGDLGNTNYFDYISSVDPLTSVAVPGNAFFMGANF